MHVVLEILFFVCVLSQVSANPTRTRGCLTVYVENTMPHSESDMNDCLTRNHLLLSENELAALHYSYHRLHDAALWLSHNHTYFALTSDVVLEQNNACAEHMLQMAFSLKRLSDFAYHHGSRDMIRTMSRPSQLHALSSISYLKNSVAYLEERLDTIKTDCNSSFDENLMLLENETAAISVAAALRNTYLTYVEENITRLVDLEEGRRQTFELYNNVVDVWCAVGRYCPFGITTDIDTLTSTNASSVDTGTVIAGPVAYYVNGTCTESTDIFVFEGIEGIASNCSSDILNMTIVPNHHLCPEGSYSNKTNQQNQETCTLCQPGFFNNQTGQASCAPCATSIQFGQDQCN